MDAAAEATRLMAVIAREEANLDEMRRLAPRLTHGALNVDLMTRKVAGFRAELAALSGRAPASAGGADAGWDRAGRKAFGDRWPGAQGGRAGQVAIAFRPPAMPPAGPARTSQGAIDAGWDRAGRQAFGDQWRGLCA